MVFKPRNDRKSRVSNDKDTLFSWATLALPVRSGHFLQRFPLKVSNKGAHKNTDDGNSLDSNKGRSRYRWCRDVSKLESRTCLRKQQSVGVRTSSRDDRTFVFTVCLGADNAIPFSFYPLVGCVWLAFGSTLSFLWLLTREHPFMPIMSQHLGVNLALLNPELRISCSSFFCFFSPWWLCKDDFLHAAFKKPLYRTL